MKTTAAQRQATAEAQVQAARWENGVKVYDRTEDGELALWYDPERGAVLDVQETADVANEAEADKLAAEWLACYASYED